VRGWLSGGCEGGMCSRGELEICQSSRFVDDSGSNKKKTTATAASQKPEDQVQIRIRLVSLRQRGTVQNAMGPPRLQGVAVMV
jgi:hypothetical protein